MIENNRVTLSLKSEIHTIPGSVAGCIVDEHRVNARQRKRRELRRGGERRVADRQLITVSKLQSRLMAKLITNGAAFRARSHASVLPADWRDAVSCPLLPARSSR